MASRSSLVDQLSAVPLFSRCTKRDLRIIARHLDMVTVSAATDVVREGERGDMFFIILAGEATVNRGDSKVSELGAGDHFGELAMLDPAPRAATVRAVTALELGTLGHRMFMVLLRDMPSLAAGLLTALAGQVREAHGKAPI